MADVVLDASAVLAVIFEEPGCDQVEACLPDAMISTVNIAEVMTRLFALKMPEDTATTVIDALQLSVEPFDYDQAVATAGLRAITRSAGLSLGDRACLSLAKSHQCPALTADTAWSDIADRASVEVKQIR